MREQEINLAKVICPQYNGNNFNWKRVMELGQEIAQINSKMAIIHKKKSAAQESQLGKAWRLSF